MGIHLELSSRQLLGQGPVILRVLQEEARFRWLVGVGCQQRRPARAQGPVGVHLKCGNSKVIAEIGAPGQVVRLVFGRGVEHDVEAKVQLSGLLQGRHPIDVGFVEARISKAGEAHGQAVLLALQQGRVGFNRAGLGDFGGDELHCVINQQAGEAALRVALNHAAADGRGRRDARQIQRLLVGQRRVPIDAGDEHRHVRKQLVQRVFGGEALAGPVVLVPAAAREPHRVGLLLAVPREAAHRFGPGGGPHQISRAQPQGIAVEVAVRVVKARVNELPVRVHRLRCLVAPKQIG